MPGTGRRTARGGPGTLSPSTHPLYHVETIAPWAITLFRVTRQTSAAVRRLFVLLLEGGLRLPSPAQ